MKIETWPRNPAGCAMIFGAASAAVYLLMINTTLAHLTALSGLAPLDLRPLGYTADEVSSLFLALGEDGRGVYLKRQIVLDTAYPALLALTLISVFRWLGQRLPHRWLIQIGIAVSLGAALFDYGENSGIAVMLLNWPDVHPVLVRLTSLASISKSLMTTAAISLVMLTALFWAYRQIKVRPNPRAQRS